MHLFLFLLGIGILNPHAYEVFFAPFVTSIQSATDTVFALFVAIVLVPQVQVAALVELLRIPPPTRVPKLPPTPTVPSPAHHLSSPLAYLVSASIMVVLLTIVFLVVVQLAERDIAVPEQQPLVQPENVPASAPVDLVNEPAEQKDIVEPEPALVPAPAEPASPVASSSNSADDDALAPASPTFTEATLVEGDEDDRIVEEFRAALAGYRGRPQMRRARPAMENPFDVHSMDDIHIQYANARAVFTQQIGHELTGIEIARCAFAFLESIQSNRDRHG
ncbi:hypothetical protein EIP91_006323 [Steccherinum ochraceum]|uniref:Uncharacterized protein n=1 Tax=Steccherinum ochraceum TaxID=92696 RepID=A0A4V2MXE3_9APHY|nr:hypothetical protein EIP91_006323 [Steccherinum ochraceum]